MGGPSQNIVNMAARQIELELGQNAERPLPVSPNGSSPILTFMAQALNKIHGDKSVPENGKMSKEMIQELNGLIREQKAEVAAMGGLAYTGALMMAFTTGKSPKVIESTPEIKEGQQLTQAQLYVVMVALEKKGLLKAEDQVLLHSMAMAIQQVAQNNPNQSGEKLAAAARIVDPQPPQAKSVAAALPPEGVKLAGASLS